MELIKRILDIYPDFENLLITDVIDIVEFFWIDGLKKLKDIKNGEFRQNSNNKKIDEEIEFVKKISMEARNNSGNFFGINLKVFGSNKNIAIYLMYVYLNISLMCYIEPIQKIIEHKDLKGKSDTEILQIFLELENIEDIEKVEELVKDDVLYLADKILILQYIIFSTANKLKKYRNSKIENKKLENFYISIQKYLKNLIIELEDNTETISFNSYIKDFFDLFEKNLFNLYNDKQLKITEFKDNLNLYSVNRKFSRNDTDYSEFGLVTSKETNTDIYFSLLERKILSLMNYCYISIRTNNILKTNNFYITVSMLNRLLFNKDKNVLSSINHQKLKEAISRLNRKKIYWDLHNSKISARLTGNVITGFENIVKIDIIYNTKIHDSNNEAISKEVKGLYFTFNSFFDLRYQIKQINKMPLELLSTVDYSFILAKNIIYNIQLANKKDKRFSLQKILKDLYVYKKDLTIYDESLYAVILKDSKNTTKRFKQFCNVLEYILKQICSVYDEIEDLSICDINNKKLSFDKLKFDLIRQDKYYIALKFKDNDI